MKNATAITLSPLESACLQFAEAHRLEKEATALKDSFKPTLKALGLGKDKVTVTHADGLHSSLTLSVQTKNDGVPYAEGLKVEGIGPAMLARITKVDTQKAKACLDAGLLTQEQYAALVQPGEPFDVIRVYTKP